jgi:hypothetical protein
MPGEPVALISLYTLLFETITILLLRLFKFAKRQSNKYERVSGMIEIKTA